MTVNRVTRDFLDRFFFVFFVFFFFFDAIDFYYPSVIFPSIAERVETFAPYAISLLGEAMAFRPFAHARARERATRALLASGSRSMTKAVKVRAISLPREEIRVVRAGSAVSERD